MTPRRPPRLAEALVRWTAERGRADAQLGDLAEEHAGRGATADRWYWRQALGTAWHNLRLRAGRALARATSRKGDGTVGTMLQDLRLALRSARTHAAFSAVVVLTVALGIGANTTVFSAVYGLILDPFPFPEPDRIVGVGTAYPRAGFGLGFFENASPAEYLDIRENARTLEDVIAWDMGNRQIDTEGPPENVFSAFLWGDALTTIGMSPVVGRGFTSDEIATGATVVMLSEATWIRRFGSDPSIVGGTLSVNGNPYTLVGIFPAAVDLYGTELWMTMPVGPEVFPRNRRQFQIMGRIAEGSTLREVNTELAGIAARIEQAHGAEFEEYEGWSMRAMTWADVNSNLFRTGAFVLMGAVTFVLLLVCANTANLLLARAQTRRREMAVRTALGAGRARLVGQLLTESVALALVGGALGVALAYLGIAGANDFLGTIGLRVAGTVELNGPVLLFTAGSAVAAGVVFGMAPALHASAVGISEALASATRSATAGASRQRLQRTLVGIEVALAFILLAGGGLFVNSFVRVHGVDTGFEPEGVMTMRLTLPREDYDGAAVPAFFRDLTERLAALPGVRAAGAGSHFPSVAITFREIFFDGAEADAEATLPTALTTVVTPGYFEALGVPLREGRTFDSRDAEGAPLAVVVSDEVARRYFPGGSAVGQRLKVGGADADAPWWEIVGVVGSTRNLGLDTDPYPEIFAAHAQVGAEQNQLFLILRADGDPAALVPAVRGEVLAMDADQPIYAIRTASEALGRGVAQMRAATLLLSALAGFALLLAAVGIYAVVSLSVSERTREIGLRVALGAGRGRVRGLVVRQALLPVLVGTAVGLAAALALGGALERLLFEVTGTDPWTLGSVAALLLAVATAASWIPAWRASRMHPVEALRLD